MSSRISRAVQDMPQPTIRGTDGILEGPIPWKEINGEKEDYCEMFMVKIQSVGH